MKEPTLDILDVEELKDQYKLRPHFIRMHGQAMGAFGKPKRWNRAEVERYLEELSTRARREREEKEARALEAQARLEAAIKRLSSPKVSQISDGKIKGRGGRVKTSAA